VGNYVTGTSVGGIECLEPLGWSCRDKRLIRTFSRETIWCAFGVELIRGVALWGPGERLEVKVIEWTCK